MKKYLKLHADIDLDAVRCNLEQMRKCIKTDTKMIPVVKADSYGHGAVPIAKELEDYEYVWGFAVAQVEEGVQLRENGIKKPVLLLGGAFEDVIDDMINNEIRGCVSNFEQAKMISDAAVILEKNAVIHLALDTGMSRIGFQVSDEAVEEIKRVMRLPNVIVEGIFTHFARADEFDKSHAQAQAEKYEKMIGMLEREGIDIPMKHISNSAAIFNHPELEKDAVRQGITLYGLTPSDDMTEVMNRNNITIKPVMSLKSHIVFIKELEEGREVSYGGTYVTDRITKVATVPAGYADGYPRLLSGKADVLIKGKRAPILGRVCMDQFMVDVSHIDDVKKGDEVTLIGTDGNETITVEELGEISGRFNYELVCDISKRVPRNYIKNNVIVSQVDYF